MYLHSIFHVHKMPFACFHEIFFYVNLHLFLGTMHGSTCFPFFILDNSFKLCMILFAYCFKTFAGQSGHWHCAQCSAIKLQFKFNRDIILYFHSSSFIFFLLLPKFYGMLFLQDFIFIISQSLTVNFSYCHLSSLSAELV